MVEEPQATFRREFYPLFPYILYEVVTRLYTLKRWGYSSTVQYTGTVPVLNSTRVPYPYRLPGELALGSRRGTDRRIRGGGFSRGFIALLVSSLVVSSRPSPIMRRILTPLLLLVLPASLASASLLGQRLDTVKARRAAMRLGMLVGHFPDLDTCHQSCQAAGGCGKGAECLCSCCDIGAIENDGCFCYSCGPIGKPVTPYSEHKSVEGRVNPVDASEEPGACVGSRQMCGGLFGDTGRGAETPAAKALRLEKQARDAAAEKEKMARQVEEMQRANAAAADTTEMAKRAVQQLSATKEEAERAEKEAELKGTEVDELENKLGNAAQKAKAAQTELESLENVKVPDLEARLKSAQEQKKKMADALAVAKLQADEIAARAPLQEEAATGGEGERKGEEVKGKRTKKTGGQYDDETGLRKSVV